MSFTPFREEENSDYIHSTWSDYSSFYGTEQMKIPVASGGLPSNTQRSYLIPNQSQILQIMALSTERARLKI